MRPFSICFSALIKLAFIILTINITCGQPNCIVPFDNMKIDSNITLCPGTYNINDLTNMGVIIINASEVTLDCSNASLVGNQEGVAIYNNYQKNVTIRNCRIKDYYTGILLKNASNNRLNNNSVETHKIGIGIYLDNASDSSLINNNVTNCNIGVLLEQAAGSTLENNTVMYNILDGIYLHNASNSQLIKNKACANIEFDIQDFVGKQNTGIRNICNISKNWNDSGTTGCIFACMECYDWDVDGVCDGKDNCRFAYNPNQADGDGDGVGDACDNCLTIYNPPQPGYGGQSDDDMDGIGNACDNCWFEDNPAQKDNDADCSEIKNNPTYWDGKKWLKDPHCGDACDSCPKISNQDRKDSDSDSAGDLCDNCPLIPNELQEDSDSDSIGDVCDNCPNISNQDQKDSDSDGVGDSCDNCPKIYNPIRLWYRTQSDGDNDGIGDDCDNCPLDNNPGQEDSDKDGIGDNCDAPCSLWKSGSLPSKFDWRDWSGQNWLTNVKDQGFCGSCWAFGTVGSIEANYKINFDKSIDLSEQYLITKNKGMGNCNGGFEKNALESIQKEGIVSENCLPYTSEYCDCINCKCMCNNTCNPGCPNLDQCSDPLTLDPLCNDWQSDLWSIKGYRKINPNPNDIKKAILCYGPLVVSSQVWKHTFLIVGWDDNMKLTDWPTKGRWIQKNSWGENYGDTGFGTLPYDHIFSDFIYNAYAVEWVYKK